MFDCHIISAHMIICQWEKGKSRIEVARWYKKKINTSYFSRGSRKITIIEALGIIEPILFTHAVAKMGG